MIGQCNKGLESARQGNVAQRQAKRGSRRRSKAGQFKEETGTAA